MRPTFMAFRARQLTVQITDAACKGTGQWWSEQEANHCDATTPTAAVEAASPALALCARCPKIDQAFCAERAELDDYTGLAAGAVYLNGRALPVWTVLPHPTPPQMLKEAG
jgi:hypothetical protein